MHGVAGSAALVLLLATRPCLPCTSIFLCDSFWSWIDYRYGVAVFNLSFRRFSKATINLGTLYPIASVGITAICMGLHRCFNSTEILLLNSLFGPFLL